MPVRIMVIDNDKNVRKLFTSILTHAGWQVFSEAYANADLTAVHQFSPNLIILDFNTRQSGVDWAFLQLLKMDDNTAAIPILVCTTANTLSPEIAGYLAGRNIHVVHKPFAATPFILIIQEILIAASHIALQPAPNVVLPILVVDDNEQLRENLTEILQMEGYLVVTAANGQLALDTVAVVRHRLIILDINMPVMDGFEFLAAYTQLPEPHSPVIICSAGTGNLNPGVLPAFVIATLPKPYDIQRMLTLIKTYAQPA
ncbi:MAG: response regulator [Chloroflexota bacterium]